MSRFNVLVYDELTSTNTVLKQRAMCGEAEGTVIIAKKQTEGRGRLGRSFFSPDKTGLYMSVLLRPETDFENSFFITPMAAVSVCRALLKLGAKEPFIKWVNDIFCDGKKVCGILAEAGTDNNGENFVVLGIGINLIRADFPEELKNIAGAAFEKKIFFKTVADAVLLKFWEIYKSDDRKEFIEEYRKRCFIIGQNITLINGKMSRNVQVIDIDSECRLVIRNEKGEIETVLAGEVSVRL